jgi:hypothetical protein
MGDENLYTQNAPGEAWYKHRRGPVIVRGHKPGIASSDLSE